MMKNSTCTDSALLNPLTSLKVNRQRLIKYKTFAIAFSYPDENFFAIFPKFNLEKEDLVLEYDRLFRSSEVWLYGCEYLVENEFQRAQSLADINGFYRAFGLETNKDRPDSLPCELEFMHYLILKIIKAPNQEKKFICQNAQKKFFTEHLYPAAKKIAEKVYAQTKNNFYREISQQLLTFLESEKNNFFRKN